MRFVFDSDLHIHSKISLCSNDPEQTNERILQYAKDNNLKTICLTDHFWDESVKEFKADADNFYSVQNFEFISAAKPLPQDKDVEFLFGCETDMSQNMVVGVSKSEFDKFDFVVIPTTHFHFTDFTIPKVYTSPKQKADFWLKKLDALVNMDLPFHKIGIAHLTCGLIDRSRENYLETLSLIDKDAMARTFKKAAEIGVGIELNSDDMKFKDSEKSVVLCPYEIARDVGCKFYCGSDAHHPKGLNEAKAAFERAIDFLELTEDQKFIIKR